MPFILKKEKSNKNVNWRFIVRLAIATVVLVAAGALSRWYFLKKNAPVLVQQAIEHHKEGNPKKAAERLRLYLRSEFEDFEAYRLATKWGTDGDLPLEDARVLLELISSRIGKGGTPNDVIESAFQMAAQLATEPLSEKDRLGFANTAEAQIYPLLATADKAKSENLLRVAICQAMQEGTKSDLAVENFLKVLKSGDSKKKDPRAYEALARTVRRPLQLSVESRRGILDLLMSIEIANRAPVVPEKDWTDEQKKIVEKALIELMVKQAQPQWKALEAQARWEFIQGNTTAAVTAADKALDLVPNDPSLWELRMEMAMVQRGTANRNKELQQVNQFERQVRELAVAGQKLDPNDPRFPFRLGVLEFERGRHSQAKELLDQAAKLAKQSIENQTTKRQLYYERLAVLFDVKVMQVFLLIGMAETEPELAAKEHLDGARKLIEEFSRYSGGRITSLSQLMDALAAQAAQEWKKADELWERIAAEKNLDQFRKQAISGRFRALNALGEFEELEAVAQAEILNTPDWELPQEVLLEARKKLNKTNQSAGDPKALAVQELAEEIQQQLALPEDDRKWAQIERQLENPDAGLKENDIRILQLSIIVMTAQKKFDVAVDRLNRFLNAKPGHIDALTEYFHLQMVRDDQTTNRRLEIAATVLDQIREHARESLQDIQQLAGDKGRLWRLASTCQDAAGLAALRAGLWELREDLQMAQSQFSLAFKSEQPAQWIVVRYSAFCLRHQDKVEILTDQSVLLLVSLFARSGSLPLIVKAIALLNVLEERDTITPPQRVQRARLYVMAGQLDEAWDEHLKLIDLFPKAPLIVREVVIFALGTSKPSTRTEKGLERILGLLREKRPEGLETLLIECSLLHLQGKTDASVKRLVDYADSISEKNPAEISRSLIQYFQGENWTGRLKIESEVERAEIGKAAQRLAQNDEPRVLANEFQPLLGKPEFRAIMEAQALRIISLRLIAIQRTDAAIQLLRERLKKQSDSVLTLTLAHALAYQEQYSEAIELAKSADLDVCDLAAQVYFTIESKAGSEAAATKSVRARLAEIAALPEITPKLSPLLMLYAERTTNPQEIELAITTYTRLIEAVPKNAIALNNLAYAKAFSEKHRETALDDIDLAIKTDAQRLEYLDTRAIVLLQMGKLDAAEKAFSAVTERLAGEVYHFHLAIAHLRHNNHALARAVWNRIKENYPLDRVPEMEHAWYAELSELDKNVEQ